MYRSKEVAILDLEDANKKHTCQMRNITCVLLVFSSSVFGRPTFGRLLSLAFPQNNAINFDQQHH